LVLQILLILVICFVTAAIAIEIRAWLVGARMITRYQKAYRICAAVMMDIVLLMVLFGPTVRAKRDPLFEISYWGITIMLSFLLVFVAMLDVRTALISYREGRGQAFKKVFGQERPEQ
jgi:hypothetical protein